MSIISHQTSTMFLNNLQSSPKRQCKSTNITTHSISGNAYLQRPSAFENVLVKIDTESKHIMAHLHNHYHKHYKESHTKDYLQVYPFPTGTTDNVVYFSQISGNTTDKIAHLQVHNHLFLNVIVTFINSYHSNSQANAGFWKPPTGVDIQDINTTTPKYQSFPTNCWLWDAKHTMSGSKQNQQRTPSQQYSI